MQFGCWCRCCFVQMTGRAYFCKIDCRVLGREYSLLAKVLFWDGVWGAV